MKRLILTYLLFFLTISCGLMAQNSPLSTGKWSKIGATKQGIYKLTGTQLNSLGFTLPIAANQLQIFSFNLTTLTDKVPANPQMGLSENAIKVVDGGDGQINALDYILFYNQGPITWEFDSSLNRIVHHNYTSADTVYYFLTLGQNGKRVGIQGLKSSPTASKNLFNQHYLFEKDTISLLNSGKTFYGTPMGQGFGKQSQIAYSFSTQGMNSASSLKSFVHIASTSYQSNGQFDFSLNNQLLHTSSLPTVSGLLFDDIAIEKFDSFMVSQQVVWPNATNLKIGFNGANSTATGWVDYVELLIKKPIGFWQDSTLEFSIEDELNKGNAANCSIQHLDTTSIIWNVTNRQQPVDIKYSMNADATGNFIQSLDSVTHFFGVRQNAFEIPFLLGPIINQNSLQNIAGVDYIIVSAPAYLNTANRYQQFQITKFGRKTIVVNAKEIYNEFSGGQTSAVAIRNFIKTVFNSAIQQNGTPPKYLLFLGIGNFNARKININNELPTYQSVNSNSILASYTTDDFFAVLNTNEDINNYNAVQQLSLSVGRIPARNVADADTIINKLIKYQSNRLSGLWENKITWVADDGDYNLHLQDAEYIINHLQNNATYWNHNKIYLDFFPSVNTTSGNTYPLANSAIKQAVQDGSILLNYTGHGNYLRLSEEAVISKDQFDQWDNANNLPLMVTASCNFAPFDQPTLPSIAWDALMKNSNGIIGLVAANRLVFAYSNKQINDLFIQQLLVKNKSGNYNTIGEALQKAKNINWSQGGDRLNDLKFNLMGDPALQIREPNYEIKINKINNQTFVGQDTLIAGNKYTINGFIANKGILQSKLNSQLALVIYDVVKNKKTIANQSTSMSVPVAVQENVLFKGKASIINGVFNIDFILPLQLANTSTPIRLSLATVDTIVAAFLTVDSVYIKSALQTNNKDTVGPIINAFLNDPLFKDGAWAIPNSQLFITLFDSAGIQTSGNVLGQDLSIWIDNDPVPIVINNNFIADLDTYQSGKAHVSLPTLSLGFHRIIIKAWDLFGNSNSDTLHLEVPNGSNLTIKNAAIYPNPVADKSRFSFEINQIGVTDKVVFEILDWSGNLIYQNSSLQMINNTRFYFDWNGLTSAGNKLFPGVYFYRFKVQTNSVINALTNTFIKL